MKTLKRVLISAAMIGLPLSAWADDDDHRRHGRGHGHERHYKHDGHRYHDHHGRHDRHDRHHGHGYYGHRGHGYYGHPKHHGYQAQGYYAPRHVHRAPVYIAPPPPVVYYPAPAGITIHGRF